MSIRSSLYSVTRAVHEQYDAFPVDPDDADAVDTWLKSEGKADTSVLFTVGRLPISVFLQVNVDQQWLDTEDALWVKIQVKVGNLALAKPGFWGPDATLLALAVYINAQ